MALLGNGALHPNGNGVALRPALSPSTSERSPRRLVLLSGGDDSEIVQVLTEYRGTEISGKRLHADLQRLAADHPGRCVAAEWLGPLGWVRFLWCRK